MAEGWVETYRGTVFRWEVDSNDHLTVAYYFSRFADAGLGVLEAVGLGPSYMRRERRACVTVDCYVRYHRELRAGDIMHATSGVIEATADGLVMGHKLFNSETGALCTTLEQRVVHVELDGRTPVPWTRPRVTRRRPGASPGTARRVSGGRHPAESKGCGRPRATR